MSRKLNFKDIMAMSLLLYMFLLLYGQLVMTSIIEEKKLDHSNIKRLILVRAQTQFGNKRKTHILFDDGTYKQGEQIDTSQSRVGKTWIVMECSKKRLRYIKNVFSTMKIEEDVREVFDGFPINTLFDVKKNN